MDYKKFFFFLLIILFEINNIICQQECSTNLECKETACCHDNVCSDSGKCKKRNKFCYGFVGVGAFVVTVIIIIHFTRKISQTKKHLMILRKTDPGSLSRNQRFRDSKISSQITQNNQNIQNNNNNQ